MAPTRFQLMSDLHLDQRPGYRVPRPPSAPFLILAGDIGDPCSKEYRAFLGDCASLYERVFLVLGNHEAYGTTVPHAVEAARKACRSADTAGRVTVLDRERFDLGPRLSVVGATLWTHVPAECSGEVACSIADYAHIQGFGVAQSNAYHARDVKWLRGELAAAEADGCRLVVVTHHAPSHIGTSAPQHNGSPLQSAFSTPLDTLLRSPVAVWVHGHTHHSHAQKRDDGTLLVANQLGLPGEDSGFNPHMVIDVEDDA